MSQEHFCSILYETTHDAEDNEPVHVCSGQPNEEIKPHHILHSDYTDGWSLHFV